MCFDCSIQCKDTICQRYDLWTGQVILQTGQMTCFVYVNRYALLCNSALTEYCNKESLGLNHFQGYNLFKY